MPDDLDPERIVVHFSPSSAEGIVRRAHKDQRADMADGLKRSDLRFVVSIWLGGRIERGDWESAAREAAQGAFEHGKIDPAGNRKCWYAKIAEIAEVGFTVRKEGYPGEPTAHYCVDMGPGEPDMARAETLVKVFRGPGRTV